MLGIAWLKPANGGMEWRQQGGTAAFTDDLLDGAQPMGHGGAMLAQETARCKARFAK